MNFTNISNIRKRLQQLIDSVLSRYDDSNLNMFGLNQSMLEDWVNLLKEAIVQKSKITKPIVYFSQTPTTKTSINVPFPQIHSTNNLFHYQKELIQIVNSQKLIVHNCIKHKINDNSRSQSIINFAKDSLKKFGTVVCISPRKYILAGGCYYSNPRLKQNSICLLDTSTGELRKIGELVEPLSSHGCLYIEPKVYFIGGKMNGGVVTKMCSYFHLHHKQIVQIAALNYACASLSVTNHKNEYIYKAGGIGECFGQYNLSPYIQRYDIRQNCWQVINPYIPVDLIDNFRNFQLFAHSMMYTSQNKLVIFGGFDIQKKGTNFGCIIAINQDTQNSIIESEANQHQFQEFGEISGLQPGGFWTSQTIFDQKQKQIISIQSCLKQSSLQSKILRLKTKQQ